VHSDAVTAKVEDLRQEGEPREYPCPYLQTYRRQTVEPLRKDGGQIKVYQGHGSFAPRICRRPGSVARGRLSPGARSAGAPSTRPEPERKPLSSGEVRHTVSPYVTLAARPAAAAA